MEKTKEITTPEYWKNKEIPNNHQKELDQVSQKELSKQLNESEHIIGPEYTVGPIKRNGAIIFYYEQFPELSQWWLSCKLPNASRKIITKVKNNNQYTVEIQKWKQFENKEENWETLKNEKHNTFSINATNKDEFNIKLWKILDKTVWKRWENRKKLPKTGGKVYELLQYSPNTKQKTIIETWKHKTNLKKKPIELKYNEKHKEAKIEQNLPENGYSIEWRITRCMRWKSITDATEDRYWIPRGLLMALMAQEWLWDPTMINQSNKWKCDWGAWLIHIQATNAHNFWLKTIQRFNDKMVDYKHWEKLQSAKTKYNNNLKELSKLDDRFNPVLSVDASARFLLSKYNNLSKDKRWADKWIHAVNEYAGRWMKDYWYAIIVYRTTINSIRNNSMPHFTEQIEKVKKWEWSAKVNGVQENVKNCIKRTKNSMTKLEPKINGQEVSLEDYYTYLEKQCENYWLKEYIGYNKGHPYTN